MLPSAPQNTLSSDKHLINQFEFNSWLQSYIAHLENGYSGHTKNISRESAKCYVSQIIQWTSQCSFVLGLRSERNKCSAIRTFRGIYDACRFSKATLTCIATYLFTTKLSLHWLHNERGTEIRNWQNITLCNNMPCWPQNNLFTYVPILVAVCSIVLNWDEELKLRNNLSLLETDITISKFFLH